MRRDVRPGGDPAPELRTRPLEHPHPVHRRHRGYVRGYRHGIYRDGPYVAAYGEGGGKATVPEMQQAMGITWTDIHEELTEAIPPAYTHWIGTAFATARQEVLV